MKNAMRFSTRHAAIRKMVALHQQHGWRPGPVTYAEMGDGSWIITNSVTGGIWQQDDRWG